MDNARLIAVDILKRVIEDGAYSSLELDKALFNSSLSNQDKAFVTSLVYGSLNNLYRIDKIIETYSSIRLDKMEHIVKNSLRLAIYQIDFMDKVPEYSIINEMVNIAKKSSIRSANFVNAVLRSYLRKEKEIKFRNDIDKLSFEYSMPYFLTKLLKDQYKKRTIEILEGSRRSMGVFLRINQTKISREEYLKKSNLDPLDLKLGILDSFVNVFNPGNIKALYGYDDGYFSVQNESAALVSYCLKERDGNLLDICSAPGGKSFYFQELKNNKASIISNDIYEAKIKIIEENAKRLDLNIKTAINDASLLNKKWINKFDNIICDVPCSGLGLLGRKPDIKININEDEIENIILLQEKILDNAARYLKDTGNIIYSTCTLNKEENESQINKFLEKHKDFELVEANISELLLNNARNGGIKNFIIKDKMVTMLPDQIYDGFFIAVLRKNKI